MALLDHVVPFQAAFMGFDPETRSIVCDLFGCWTELPVPIDITPLEAVDRSEGWSFTPGSDLYRCPEHPFRPRPWLS